jgi:hypothetical protein
MRHPEDAEWNVKRRRQNANNNKKFWEELIAYFPLRKRKQLGRIHRQCKI